MRLNRLASANDTLSIQAIPTAPSHQAEANPLIAQATQSNLAGWANG